MGEGAPKITEEPNENLENLSELLSTINLDQLERSSVIGVLPKYRDARAEHEKKAKQIKASEGLESAPSLGSYYDALINCIILIRAFQKKIIDKTTNIDELPRKLFHAEGIFSLFRFVLICEIGGNFIKDVFRDSGAKCDDATKKHPGFEASTDTSKSFGANLNNFQKAFRMPNIYDYVVTNQVFSGGSGIVEATLGENAYQELVKKTGMPTIAGTVVDRVAGHVLLATQAKLACKERFIINHGNSIAPPEQDFVNRIGLKRVATMYSKHGNSSAQGDYLDILTKKNEHDFSQEDIVNMTLEKTESDDTEQQTGSNIVQ